MVDRQGPSSALQRAILAWYAENRRELPWRGETDPYKVLVSEIMLQQTGVERVITLYPRFLGRFPSFEALAQAPRGEVLRAWAGLGYNRRAVLLHECARVIVDQHGGSLPGDPAALRRLPGLGAYTVAAIRCFVFHQDVATVDTNVRRVVSRLLFGGTATNRQIDQAASELLPPGRGSDWNQALMDLGSLVCTAIRPRCSRCPVQQLCQAQRSDSVDSAPIRQVAERRETYAGSRRYYRGRIVARLRELPPGESLTPGEVLATIKPDGAADDLGWLTTLIQDLAKEGLVRITSEQEGWRVAMPD